MDYLEIDNPDYNDDYVKLQCLHCKETYSNEDENYADNWHEFCSERCEIEHYEG